MDQTIAFLGGDQRMRLLAQMMAADGYEVCSWELSGAPNPQALCDALKARRSLSCRCRWRKTDT